VIYLSDNDIIEKLAVCDLLDETLESFGASPKDVYVLSTLKFRIGGKLRTKSEQRLGVAAVDRVLRFLGRVQEIPQPLPTDLLKLDDIMGIDIGELILLSTTSLYSDYLFLTGDKRCLKALVSQPECNEIALRIKGKVVCFEQVLLRLIEQFGFTPVLAKVVDVRYCDTALRAAFGSGLQSTESNSVACLQSYISELRGLPIDLLITS
jgi:hypothetical protein